MSQTKLAHTFARLRNWVQEVNPDATKQAAERGHSTHPSATAPDGQEKPPMGARFAENERDVKEHVPGGGIDGASSTVGSQEDQQVQIGTKKTEVGDDPSVEQNYEGRPSATPTSHPANVEVGPKYSFDIATADGSRKAAAYLSGLADDINATIAVHASDFGKNTKTAAPAPASGTQPTQAETLKAAEAGYELAAYLGLSKEAADVEARAVIEYTTKEAMAAADRVGRHLVWYARKMADAGAPDVGTETPEEEAAEAGASAPEAGGGAMPPMAAGGAMPPGAGGDDGSGGDEQAMQEVMMALAEMGISPEQLLAMAEQAQQQGGGAGGAGAMPPGAGAMPPGAADGGMPDGAAVAAKAAAVNQAVAVATKVAHECRSFQRSGKFEWRPTKDAAERQAVNTMKSHIRELTKRLGRN